MTDREGGRRELGAGRAPASGSKSSLSRDGIEASDPDAVLEGLETSRVKFGLERMARLVEHFGPAARNPAVVLIAGTNGKGSTAAFLASIVSAAGLRSGLYTSPHLEGVEERLRIDGRAIGRAELALLLKELLVEIDRANLDRPSYFELLTLAAAVWFRRHDVEVAVFEVGLGGRLDATNAFQPVLSVITEIGLDHCRQLGDSLSAIAAEKAGIMRPGVPVIVGMSEPEAREAIERSARDLGAVLLEVSGPVPPSCLPGSHQRENLELAATAARRLAAMGWEAIDEEAIERGATGVRWPGRLERIELDLGAGVSKVVWLDGAHNPLGAERLAEFLAGLSGGSGEAGGRQRTFDVLFGVLDDKDAASMVAPIAPQLAFWTVTRVPGGKAQEPEALARLVAGAASRDESGAADSRGRVQVVADARAALDAALAGERDLVVFGSLYLVGWVRRELRRRWGVPSALRDLFAPTR